MNQASVFRVPDFGMVEIDNAVFVQFLQSLRNLRGEPIKLADMQVGQRANAVFQMRNRTYGVGATIMSQLGTDWIGSIISATLREQDLIPAFEGVLDVAGVEYDRPMSVDKLLLGQPLTDEETEEVSFYLNETLFDLLNEIAPKGTYFGSHPGDGADFGFWENEEESDDSEARR